MDHLAALLRHTVPDPRPDGELLAAFLGDRDERAFTELVRRHGPMVWSACSRALSAPPDAEDAFQATFLVLVRRADRLTAASTVGPWLLKVATQTAANVRRKNARRRDRFADLPDAVPNPRPSPESAPDVDGLLRGIPERCRAAVLLCHLEGLTHREAAVRMGCPEGTVSSLVSRGLAKLRARLAGRDPVVVLLAAVVAPPAVLSAATVRSAVAFGLVSDSAVVPLGVAALTRGVLRMFWLRKASAATAALVAVLVAGIVIGMSVRQTPQATAEEVPAVHKPEPAPAPRAAPYVVLTVRSRENGRSPYTLTECDGDGTVRWGVVPGATADQVVPANPLMPLKDGKIQGGVVGSTRDYLTRVRKDPNAPKDLRVVLETDAPLGTDVEEALRCCVDAGFEKIHFTGYIPFGGYIPQLVPGTDGEATGYRRYKGEVVEAKKLLEDYSKAIRSG